MEVLPSVRFYEDLHLFAWKPHGILDEATVNKVLADLLRYECRASQPFNRFSDLSKLQAFHLTFNYVFQVALHRRLAYAGREPVSSNPRSCVAVPHIFELGLWSRFLIACYRGWKVRVILGLRMQAPIAGGDHLVLPLY